MTSAREAVFLVFGGILAFQASAIQLPKDWRVLRIKQGAQLRTRLEKIASTDSINPYICTSLAEKGTGGKNGLSGMKTVLLHLMGRDVEVRYSFAADLKSVNADTGQIEQVVVNIVMNAADAMPQCGDSC